MSRLRKNTIQLTLASVGQKVLAFLYFLLLARTIGTENTGAYFLALSITTMFSVITDFGLQPVLIREVAKQKENWKDILRSTVGLKILFTAIAAASVIIFVNIMGYDVEVTNLVYVAIAVMAVDAITLTMYGLLRGVQILAYESVGMFVGQSITVAFGTYFLLTGAPLVYLVLALLAGSVFNACFSTWMVIRRFGTEVLRPKLSKNVTIPLLKIALPFALAGIFVKIYSYVDTIAISKYFGEYDVGIYAVAYKLTYAFQFLPLAFVAALYPAMSALVKTNREKLSRVFDQSMLYMMFLVTPITFGIFAISDSLINVTVGPEFAASAPVLQVLIFVLFFLFLDFPIGSLLNAADRQALKTTLMGFTMVINVVANLILVPKMGVMGAAIAANISFAFLLISGWYFVPRFVKSDWRMLVSKLLRIFLAGLGMTAVVMWADQTLNPFFTIPLGGVLYIFFLVLFGLIRGDELRSIKRFIKRSEPAQETEYHDV